MSKLIFFIHMVNPNFSVRFRVQKRNLKRGEKTSLQMRVWVSAIKCHFTLTTDIALTEQQWKQFRTDGTPKLNADPDIIKQIDLWKASATLVMSDFVANNRLETTSSNDFKLRVQGIKGRIQTNEKEGRNAPILIDASPYQVSTCADCMYKGRECYAPWMIAKEAKLAPELAAYNGHCPKRMNSNGKIHPNPKFNDTSEPDARAVKYAAWAIMENAIERAKGLNLQEVLPTLEKQLKLIKQSL